MISQNFDIFYTSKCILRVRMLCSCSGAFTRKKGGINVFASLAPSRQTVESLLRITLSAKPARKFWQKVFSVNSLELKNTLNYFSSNRVCKVKNLTNFDASFLIVLLFNERLSQSKKEKQMQEKKRRR